MQLKYNPGFNSDEDQKALFVVRERYAELVIETIRENTGSSSQHVLIVGPRGIGKTSLVVRVAAEIRTDPALKIKWLPVIFSEESYEVTTPGEFWLAALERLAGQTGSTTLKKSYSLIRQEHDEVALRERALGQLLSFCKSEHKRLILIVENLNMLLGEQLSEHDAWDLRHTLLNESEIMLLGTAVTNIFSTIRHSGKAWFELFTMYQLDPLTAEETATLWNSVTNQHLTPPQLRPVQILTGGNPRLIRILADFATRSSFQDLLENLIHLIDEHTEYFKSQLDTLPAIERKVFVTLLDFWEPASAQNIAIQSRMSTSAVSANLNRLAAKGAVSVNQVSLRKKVYQATERLYNIYYLMRKHGDRAHRVQAAVRFMLAYYRDSDFVKSAVGLAREACSLEPLHRTDHYLAYAEFISHAESPLILMKILKDTPLEFFQSGDTPEMLSKMHERLEQIGVGEISDTDILMSLARKAEERNSEDEAERLLRKVIELDPKNGHAWFHLGDLLLEKREFQKAREALTHGLEFDFDNTWGLITWSRFLEESGDKQGALLSILSALEKYPDRAQLWVRLGDLQHEMECYVDAEASYRRATISKDKEVAGTAWQGVAEVLHFHLHRFSEAAVAYERGVKLLPSVSALVNLAELYSTIGVEEKAKHGIQRAEKLIRKTLRTRQNDPNLWYRLGQLLRLSEKLQESEAALRKAISLDPTEPSYRDHLIDVFVAENRLDSARELCQEGIESSGTAEDWRRLGYVEEYQERFSEAATAYRRAVSIDSNYSSGWSSLGLVLLKDVALMSRLEEAEKALSRAAEISGLVPEIWVPLIQTRASLGMGLSRIQQESEGLLNANQRTASLINEVAWGLYKTDEHGVLTYAESLAREAAGASSDWNVQHTLMAILAAESKWPEALNVATPVFLESATNDSALRCVTEFSIDAAVAGFGEGILDLIRRTNTRTVLEPLYIAVVEVMGEKVVAPLEIAEVAKDIIQQIRHRTLEGQ
jgi:tetratricopeptide (TPR) repeat protein